MKQPRLLGYQHSTNLTTGGGNVLGPDPRRRRIILPGIDGVKWAMSFVESTFTLTDFQMSTAAQLTVMSDEDFGDLITHSLCIAVSAPVATYIFWTAGVP